MARDATLILMTALVVSGVSSTAAAQEPARGRGAAVARITRPPLFLREEWKQTPAGGEHPVVPSEALSNPNLELKLYGSTSKEIQLTGGAQDENNPVHLWTGLCTTPCAVRRSRPEPAACACTSTRGTPGPRASTPLSA